MNLSPRIVSLTQFAIYCHLADNLADLLSEEPPPAEAAQLQADLALVTQALADFRADYANRK